MKVTGAVDIVLAGTVYNSLGSGSKYQVLTSSGVNCMRIVETVKSEIHWCCLIMHFFQKLKCCW